MTERISVDEYRAKVGKPPLEPRRIEPIVNIEERDALLEGFDREDVIEFFVDGKPAPGGSKNAFRNKYTGKIMIVDAGGKGNKDWKKAVAYAAKQAYQGEPLECAVMITVIFSIERPKTHFKKSGGLVKGAPEHAIFKPDVLKLMRSTEDALTGIVWKDDSQVIHQSLEKHWGERGGASIRVEAVR